MRKATIFVSALALGSIMYGQDDLSQYQTWMKAAAGASGAARKAVTDKDAGAIAANAKTAQENFDNIAKFFAAKHKEDAQKAAQAASDAAKKLASASGEADQTAALNALNGTCRDCHTTYRDGNKFKGL
jgi:hypothetical protein